ncbi:hypothetical protein AB0B40_32170, partial [Streptomyces sp. NPDC042638]
SKPEGPEHGSKPEGPEHGSKPEGPEHGGQPGSGHDAGPGKPEQGKPSDEDYGYADIPDGHEAADGYTKGLKHIES